MFTRSPTMNNAKLKQSTIETEWNLFIDQCMNISIYQLIYINQYLSNDHSIKPSFIGIFISCYLDETVWIFYTNPSCPNSFCTHWFLSTKSKIFSAVQNNFAQILRQRENKQKGKFLLFLNHTISGSPWNIQCLKAKQ